MSNFLDKSTSLIGKHAFVTGATGYLGSNICALLAELGASLVILDRDQDKLNDFSHEIREKYKVDCKFICLDLSVQDKSTKAIKSVLDKTKRLDILINNAAYVGSEHLEGWNTDFENQSLDTWRAALEVNLTSPFWLCQTLLPYLEKSEAGSIINISSIYGSCAPRFSIYENTDMHNPAAYAASKAGLVQFTKWLAASLAPKIRVNAISPGGIERGQPECFQKKYSDLVPMQRMAKEDDILGAIVYLATDLSRYVTGQNLFVDGGWSIF